MSDHEFLIKTSEIDAGGKDYRFVIRAPWLRGVLEGHEATATSNDGLVEVRASKSGADVVVHGTLNTSVKVPCARCLDPVDVPVHSDLSVIYVPGSKVKDAEESGKVEYTLEDAEADTLPYDGETVVLDDLVRDEVLLGVPMIPLCSDDCPGMSPAPETDATSASEKKEIDPRLAPLLAFRGKPEQTK
jgi:uncharacterized protein